MPEHIYEKEDLIQRFDRILNKTFEQIDNVGMFEHVRKQDKFIYSLYNIALKKQGIVIFITP